MFNTHHPLLCAMYILHQRLLYIFGQLFFITNYFTIYIQLLPINSLHVLIKQFSFQNPIYAQSSRRNQNIINDEN